MLKRPHRPKIKWNNPHENNTKANHYYGPHTWRTVKKNYFLPIFIVIFDIFMLIFQEDLYTKKIHCIQKVYNLYNICKHFKNQQVENRFLYTTLW